MGHPRPRVTLHAAAVVCLMAGTAAADSFRLQNPGQILRGFLDEPGPALPAAGPGGFRGLPANYGDGHGGYGDWSGEAVKRLAHSLDERSSEIRAKYRDEKPGNFFEKMSWRAAYDALESLEREADHFHRQIEGRWQDPEHTRGDYARLVEAYNNAAAIAPNAYHFRRIRLEWGQLESVMHGLEQAYRGGRRRGRWQWERVKRLAHEVEEKAEHVHREAESRSHHGDYWERRALADLHALEEKAGHFHRQVESYRQDPRHTRGDFSALMRAYDEAERSFRNAHAYQHVREDFYRMRDALRELESQYEDSGGGGGHDDHYGDHDRGRYPDRDDGHGQGRDGWRFEFRW